MPGRLRLRLAALRGNAGAAAAMGRPLHAMPGVLAVEVNALTGSVLLRHAVALSADDIIWSIRHGTPAADDVRDAAGRTAPTSTTAEPAPLPWHAMAAETVLRQLETPGLDGLSAPEAERRLLRHGPNLVPRPRPRSALSIFLEQLTSLPVLLLGASAVVSIATGGLGDAVVILAAVLANASIATATEEQAERTILAMDDVAVPPAPVRRDGRPAMIPAEALVPGDIVPVAPGMLVPADLRRLLAADLTVNESALTGESLPVAKSASAALR